MLGVVPFASVVIDELEMAFVAGKFSQSVLVSIRRQPRARRTRGGRTGFGLMVDVDSLAALVARATGRRHRTFAVQPIPKHTLIRTRPPTLVENEIFLNVRRHVLVGGHEARLHLRRQVANRLVEPDVLPQVFVCRRPKSRSHLWISQCSTEPRRRGRAGGALSVGLDHTGLSNRRLLSLPP